MDFKREEKEKKNERVRERERNQIACKGKL